MSRRTRLLGVGALALLAAGVFGAGVPLYDGVGFPDDPYRYVAPPASAVKTPAPVTAVVKTALSDGSNPQGFEVASTPEAGPQVSIYVPALSLIPLESETSVTVTATPVAPGVPAPPNGPVTGNVYRVTASSGGQSVALAKGTAGTITLRAPVGFTVIPRLDFRAPGSTTWAPVQTSRVGNDIFEAPFTQLGDYAAVLPTNGSSATGGSSKTIIIVLLAVLALGLITIAVVRGFRSIGDAPDLSGSGYEDLSSDPDD